MSVHSLRTIALSEFAVAEGATTPVPSGPCWAWSSILSKPVYWDGSKWTAGTGGASAGTDIGMVSAISSGLALP